MAEGNADQPWSFLTSQGLALVCIAHDPRVRVRDIALAIDVTERTAQRVVSDLVNAGYVLRERDRRRNVYTVRGDVPFRLPLEREVKIGELLAVLAPPEAPPPPTSPPLTPSPPTATTVHPLPR